MSETTGAAALAAELRAALEATRERAFPANPVLQRLKTEKSFTHNGQVYRTAHRLQDEVCTTVGRLIIARGLTRILEIGTLFGFGTLHWAEAAAATGGHVETVDLRPATLKWDRHRQAEPQTMHNVHEVAERFVAESGLGERVTFRAGDSNAVLPELVRDGRRFDLAVVDGAHDFPTALLDAVGADALLPTGGYLVLDDVDRAKAERNNNAGGPNRLVATLFASGRYAIVPLTAHAVLCRKDRP